MLLYGLLISEQIFLVISSELPPSRKQWHRILQTNHSSKISRSGAGHLRLCDAQAAPTCFESCSFVTLPPWTASPLCYSKAHSPRVFFSWLRLLLAPLNLVMLYDSCCRSSCDYPQTGTSKKKRRRRSKRSFSSSSIPLRSPPCLWTGGWLCAGRYAIYSERKLGERAAERLERWTTRQWMWTEEAWRCRRGSWRGRRGEASWRRWERECAAKWRGRFQRRRGRGGCQKLEALSWNEERRFENEKHRNRNC